MKVVPFMALAFILFYIYSDEYYSDVVIDFIARYPLINQLFYGIFKARSKVAYKDTSGSDNSGILFTSEELKNYGSNSKTGTLYLGLLGQIFDVTKGKKFYGPGGSYEFFTGRDASRAFITGDFSDDGLSDDLTGLSHEDLGEFQKWLKFYTEEYSFVGKLIGRYYHPNGRKTLYLKEIEELIKKAEMERRLRDAEKQEYPSCNAEWTSEKGGRVWCSKESGGVKRDWEGVPRKLYVPGNTAPRCVCIRGPSEQGSMKNAKLEEYPGCPKDDSSCVIH